jgi:hypothetical protein
MNEQTEAFPVPNSRMCLWYYKGSQSQEPRVAIITAYSAGGSLDLTIFPRNTKHLTLASGVRHKDDPYHKQRPTQMQESGTWDYLPGEDPRETPATYDNNVTSISGIEPHRRGPGRPPKVLQNAGPPLEV